jgi:hypothetical protein
MGKPQQPTLACMVGLSPLGFDALPPAPCFLPSAVCLLPIQRLDRLFSSHETNCFSGQVFTTSPGVSQARRATETPKRM